MIKINGALVKDFKHWVFPGGEIGVKFEFHPWGAEYFSFTWKVDNKNNLHQEFFILANAVDAIRQEYPKADIDLLVHYFPYARQDRVCHKGESHAKKVFESLLASLNLKNIFVRDLHSDVSSIDTSNISQAHGLYQFDLSEYEFLVAPDAGAKEKTASCVKIMPNRVFQITMEKVRKDGKVFHEPLYLMKAPAFHGLVVDDICDGGATFISVAKAIKENNRHIQLDLYVTHGIFSKGLEELKQHYGRIFCYNLMNLDLVDQVEHII
jgi:ribose-phosphate pyrophosphokinase